MALSVINGSETPTLVQSLIPNSSQFSLPGAANQQQQTPTVNNARWDSPVEVLHLKENELVFKEGETPKGFYFLKSGSLKVVVNRSFTRGRMTSPEFINKVVGPGEFFGFKSLIKGTNYNYFARTLKPSEIYLYSQESLLNILKGPNTLEKMLILQMVRDLEASEMISQLHYLASVQERIAYQLVLLADKFGVPTAQGVSLNLRLTRNELAQLAGTINESLSRHLTEFKNEGVIDLNGKEIIIKNRQALMMKSGNFKMQ